MTVHPTGELTVRFDRAPTDAELETFAAAFGLVFRHRNEFVAEQAIFVPRTPVPIEDLVDQVGRAPGVARAWGNARSDYRRA